ncbi:MAG: endopeptidase La [Clostridia bacterium]|nr:endopeptidase La [Clostridia bacterium]
MKLSVPYEKLPVVALRGLAVLPGEILHFDAGRPKTIAAVQTAVEQDSLVFLTSQLDPRQNEIKREDINTIGTVCRVRQVLKLPGDSIRVLAEGICRAEAGEFIAIEPYFEAFVQRITADPHDPVMGEALRRRLSEAFREYASISNRINADTILNIEDLAADGEYADAVAEQIIKKVEEKQLILECIQVTDRLAKVLELVSHELEILRVDKRIALMVRKQVDKNQKDYYLREQIKAIHQELGDTQGSAAEEYRKQMEGKTFPENVKTKLTREIDRLEDLPAGSHETPVAESYIECVLELPWSERTEDNLDLNNARKILDDDHYGLTKVKERVLESLAVAKLTDKVSGQILCFAGPPGVGKTSICASIAAAMGRKFVRMSLGGVRDEAEIRGHRRTYIGAQPGRILSAMRQAGTVNPMILFDEIDKMASDYQCDPAAAMLEVLDSAQNFAFRDHFLELPYDLSEVMFVTTANDLGNIPKPLRDRMEIIEVDGYIEDEKVQIAQRHLVKKQMEKHGLKRGMLTLSEAQIRTIISGYTAEAGVRELERCIASVCRKAACEIADGAAKVRMNRQKLIEYLGQPKIRHDAAEQKPQVGVVNGLAWTAAGGEMLNVEAGIMPGTGKLELTGHLGEVMQESAKAALTYVRAHADEFGLAPDFYSKHDIHIHVPEGATPKDGPSAGVTMVTALVSAYTGRPVRPTVAMTGEVTLRGRVLPIGGLREKLLAAVRAGIQTVIIPAENRKDMEKVPESVKSALKVVYAAEVGTVLKTALMPSVESRAIIPMAMAEAKATAIQ